jgi:ribonuclease HII
MLQCTPTLAHEETLWQQGFRAVVGVDEAGRGALAGPVVAGAAIIPPFCVLEGIWAAVRDSKQLAPARRAALALEIMAQTLAWGVGVVSAAEIDAVGIAPATRTAMLLAVEMAAQSAPQGAQPDYLLIDWVRLPMLALPQQSLIKADATIVSVAAASILAKVHRDALLCACDADFPAYGFAAHKGYGTAAHLAALAAHGPCALHRRTFAPLKDSG